MKMITSICLSVCMTVYLSLCVSVCLCLIPRSQEQIELARKTFEEYDKDNSGSIDHFELRALLEHTLSRKLPDSLYDMHVRAVMDRTDTNKNQVIEFDEFLKLYERLNNAEMPISLQRHASAQFGMSKASTAAPGSPSDTTSGGGGGVYKKPAAVELSEEMIREARAAFDKYDVNGDGSIDRDELRRILEDIQGAKKMSKLLFERYLSMVMNEADKDGGGTLDFDEFLLAYNKIFNQQQQQQQQPPIMMMGMPPRR